ncbi:MAG TPA: TIM44-like domain-containing protein [Anaeromyxobacteraceae bacterium]|nr:TIM44-like domain-containing protein [Anaeromyxobacteraceae bacterium]
MTASHRVARRCSPALPALAFALAAVLGPDLARARGGGGCLEAGTRVATPRGEVPVEALEPGDAVWTVVAGTYRQAAVVARTEVEPDEYLEIRAGERLLHATSEHPVEVAGGVFRLAARLRPGDEIRIGQGGAAGRAILEGVRRVRANGPAFNLLVMPGGTYVANGVIVHNKGCFLPDTPVTRPDGTAVSIRALRPGDQVLAFTPDGSTVTTTVRRVIALEVEEYVVVQTERTVLRVTSEHPLFVGDGTFKTVEALRPGDVIYVLNGGVLAPERVVRLEPVRAPERVYNLQTDRPNTFFASGVAVHNKGGGGGHAGGSHGGGLHGGYHSSHAASASETTDTWVPVVIALLLLLFVVYALAKGRKQHLQDDLDYSFDRSAIERKAVKTRKLLEFLARQDRSMAPETLDQVARSTFARLQQCWEARDYEPMRTLLASDLYAEHAAQLAAMRASHEVDKIEGLVVEAVDVVNVRYTEDPAHREFTALFSARARDYYVDDRTGAFLRGDKGQSRFQEFWTFQRSGEGWVLREIEQSRESDALRQENFFEQFTDLGRDQVYGDAARQPGPGGPWLEKQVETKATRIERMLNFLVLTDKLWDRQGMLERARQVFLQVMLARVSGDAAKVPGDDLFPDVAEALGAEIDRLARDRTRLEFRNLCVRKAELVLVRNFADNSKDEYTVRISAHAQRIVRRDGREMGSDADVTPFTEFWTFGRRDGQWKLKEVLPPAAGAEALRAENVDEESSPEQVQWYYRQTRAS